MDVALDSNIILNDPRMEGNAFQSLLDYLRRANSRLVLSKVVIDEVIARYPALLKKEIKNLSRAVGTLSHIVVEKTIEFPLIDIDQETRRLGQKLLKPSKNINASQVVANFSDIKIEEVVRRGINRVPPANDAGEELRDVIHWLMILEHLRTSKSELAFITSDKHFQHEAGLHPHLEQEIRDGNLSLKFYSSLDDFVKDNSPTPQSLSESEAFSFIGKAEVLDRFEIDARPFLQTSLAFGHIIERDLRLLRGALYDVGPESQFGEMEFEAELITRVVTQIPIVNAALGYTDTSGVTSFMPGVNSYIPSSLTTSIMNFNVPDPWKDTSVPAIWQGTKGYNYFGPSQEAYTSVANFISPHSGTFTESTSDFHITGRIVISLRIVSGKVANVQTERIEVSPVEKLTEKR